MAFFRKKREAKYLKQVFGEDDVYIKQKRKRRMLSLAIFFVIILIIIINAVYYLKAINFDDYYRYVDSITMRNMSENDLQLVWSKNSANADVIKSKLEYVSLTTPAEDLNAITIKSASNHPTKNLNLNFNEVAYLANTIINYNSNFTLIDFVWEINGNIASVSTHYSYSTTAISTSTSTFFFEEVFDYNFADNTICAKYDKLLNVGEKGRLVTDLTQLAKIRIALTQFILQPTIQTITDITETKGENNNSEFSDIEKQSRSLCEMLGYTNIVPSSAGMEYSI